MLHFAKLVNDTCKYYRWYRNLYFLLKVSTIPISILLQKVTTRLLLLPILSCTFISGSELVKHIHHLWYKTPKTLISLRREVCRPRVAGAYLLPISSSALSEETAVWRGGACLTRSIWKMLGPFATASRFTLPFTRCRYCRTPPLSHASCASMSTTMTTTTTCHRGDHCGPIEWAQLSLVRIVRVVCVI